MPEAAGWDASADAWIETVEHDLNRVCVLDQPMLEQCGTVAGRRVLDIGCGEGRFARMLAERGAEVSGIDPTAAFIEVAKAKHPEGDYRVGVAEDLPYPDASFDLLISYVALVDIPDFRTAISEMARVLRPGGRAVVSNLQSFATARLDPWIEDAQGNRLYFSLDNYMEERADDVAWKGISITNFHRPLSAYLESFLANGFILKRFIEPLPSDEAIRKFPRLADYYRVPWMHLTTWEKPGG